MSHHSRCGDLRSPSNSRSCWSPSLLLIRLRLLPPTPHQQLPPPCPRSPTGSSCRRDFAAGAAAGKLSYCTHIHKTLTSVRQVTIQSEPSSPSIDLQTQECASEQSPIPFNVADLKVGKQRLRQLKSVTFAPLPTPWRHGTHPSMMLLVHAQRLTLHV